MAGKITIAEVEQLVPAGSWIQILFIRRGSMYIRSSREKTMKKG